MNYEQLLQKLDAFDPLAYSKTRNFTDGAVTELSPFISRGFIDTKTILEHLIKRGFKYYQLEKFIQQMAWREYFQRVWQQEGDRIDKDLKHDQGARSNNGMPLAVAEARTGVNAVDQGIQQLKSTGMMHNHMRMYVAFLAANLAGFHWHAPAKWMYYHLLDGDWASNALSWQWVAGTFSHKKYIANQDNINHYTRSVQKGSYLDHDYDAIATASTPEVLLASYEPELKTALPETAIPDIDANLPVLVYNYYHLSPTWRMEENANRILLLEPDLFESYPVSSHCVDFMLSLSASIPGIQVYTGGFDELKMLAGRAPLIYREHPLNSHYSGVMDDRTWMLKDPSIVTGSFFSFWKKFERSLHREYFQ
jgi:deoxyribodipyrimidine photo-lyase